MGVYLDDVAYWVREWAASGEPISEAVARTIASYWMDSAETGMLAAFALEMAIDTPELREALLEDIESTIRYVRSGGFDSIELEAVKAWLIPRMQAEEAL